MTEVKLEGTEELLRNLQRIDQNVRTTAAVQAVQAGAYQIMNKARINAPVLTGALRNSMKVDARSVNGRAEAEISVNVVYARIQEYGGTITARNKPYPVFRTKGGQWVRTKSVTIKAKHYLENAITSESGRAVQAMGDVIKGYLEK